MVIVDDGLDKLFLARLRISSEVVDSPDTAPALLQAAAMLRMQCRERATHRHHGRLEEVSDSLYIEHHVGTVRERLLKLPAILSRGIDSVTEQRQVLESLIRLKADYILQILSVEHLSLRQ